MRLTFIQTSSFVGDWRRLRLNDEDLRALELLLLQQPHAGKLIPQTGGLRKVRFAPPSWRRGKSGAVRICYAHFARASTAFFLAASGKSEQENISASDKAQYRKLLRSIESLLAAEEMNHGEP